MVEDYQIETRIVLMSQELSKLYHVTSLDDSEDYYPITFYDPQECLDLMVDAELEQGQNSDDPLVSEDQIERIEKQWGELELRLSFFTNRHNWQ